jgi:hypothetical protein
MPPVTVYWSDSIQGDGYLPPGMTADDARKIKIAGRPPEGLIYIGGENDARGEPAARGRAPVNSCGK